MRAWNQVANSRPSGSIKANIGHLEGASGLAGILKAVLILEKGEIPPNALFERINPEIDTAMGHIAVRSATSLYCLSGLILTVVDSN
jgi:acyl transferase domain-containing protein